MSADFQGRGEFWINLLHHSWPPVAHRHPHLHHTVLWLGAVAAPQLGLLLEQAHPCSFWHRRERTIPGKSSGPRGSRGCAASALGTSSAEVLYPLYWGSSNSCHRIQHIINHLGLIQNCYQFVSSSQFSSSSSPQPVGSA